MPQQPAAKAQANHEHEERQSPVRQSYEVDRAIKKGAERYAMETIDEQYTIAPARL